MYCSSCSVFIILGAEFEKAIPFPLDFQEKPGDFFLEAWLTAIQAEPLMVALSLGLLPVD